MDEGFQSYSHRLLRAIPKTSRASQAPGLPDAKRTTGVSKPQEDVQAILQQFDCKDSCLKTESFDNDNNGSLD